MSQEDLINSYVQVILQEVSELQKSKFLLQAQLLLKDKEIQEVVELKNRIEAANIDLVAKLTQATEKRKGRVKLESTGWGAGGTAGGAASGTNGDDTF